MSPYERFLNLSVEEKECISYINFDENVRPSLSNKKIIFDHSCEAFNREQYNQFDEHITNMGFSKDEWLFIHNNLATEYPNGLSLDAQYYRLVAFVKKINKGTIKYYSPHGLYIYYPFSDNLIEELLISKRTHKYFAYNGSPHIHRLLFIDDLVQKDLMKYGLISLLEKPTEDDFELIESGQFGPDDALRLKTVRKFNKNNEFFKTAPHIISEIPLGQSVEVGYGAQDTLYDFDAFCAVDKSHMLNTFFCVVPETNCFQFNQDEKYLFITEKSYKSIVHHPSIILGRANTLKHLRKLGFKTFPEMFDESYDSETNDLKRYEMVLEQVEKLCNLEYDELQNKYEKCMEVILYNQKVMLEETHTINSKRKEIFEKY